MDITQDIQKAIENQLPSAVGDVLKQRLQQAETDANKVAALESSLKTTRQERDTLLEINKNATAAFDKLSHDYSDILDREAAVTIREKEMFLNELRVQMYQERIADLKQVTLAVFANNKYKYTESGFVPCYNPPTSPGGMGYTSQQNTSKTVEGEG